MSLWIMPLLWMWSKATRMHATKKPTSAWGILTSFGFAKAPLATDVVAQISTRHQVHDEKERLLVLETIGHVDDEAGVRRQDHTSVAAWSGCDVHSTPSSRCAWPECAPSSFPSSRIGLGPSSAPLATPSRTRPSRSHNETRSVPY